MSHQVYARLSGFGWTLLADVPFRFDRAAHEPRSIIATRPLAEGMRRAMLSFNEDAPVVRLDDGTDRLDEVLEVLAGPAYDCWRIETTVYSVRWPDMFAVQSTVDPPGFDFIGPGGMLVFLQGPFDPRNLPALAETAAEGQTVHRIGSNWIELDYLHEGALWRQTHCQVIYGSDVIVVTSQAPVDWHALVSAVATGVAESLLPMLAV